MVPAFSLPFLSYFFVSLIVVDRRIEASVKDGG